MSKYDYLKKYTAAEWRKRGFPEPFLFSRYNRFGPKSLEEIEQAEAKLGFQFPSQLREFYLEIGNGYLVAPYNTTDENYHFGNSNEILPPMVVAEFYKPLGEDPRGEPEYHLESSDEQHWMSPDDYIFMQKGCMPFFMANSARFLTLMPHSSNPNAVWDDFGEHIVEESFEKFIWRLYYEDPAYYDDVITAYMEKQKSQAPSSLMNNDLKRGEMANSLVLHDWQRNPIDWKGLFYFLEEWFLKSGVTPTHMGLSGDNACQGRSVIQFNNGKRRLEKFNFEGFTAVEISALPHNWNDTSDYLFYACFDHYPNDMGTLTLCWDDQIIPFEREYVENLAKEIDPYTKPAYGYGYQRKFKLGPECYATGVIRGISTDSLSPESEQISQWGSHYRGGDYRTGLFRDIYPVNIISEAHLRERVVFDKFPLHKWIRFSGDRNGTLHQLNDRLWSWYVRPEIIELVRYEMIRQRLLLAFQEPNIHNERHSSYRENGWKQQKAWTGSDPELLELQDWAKKEAQIGTGPDPLELQDHSVFSHEILIKKFRENPMAAKGYFIYMLNRKTQYEIFKTKIDKIPPHILETLIEMILSRSSFHQEQCDEIKKMIQKT